MDLTHLVQVEESLPTVLNALKLHEKVSIIFLLCNDSIEGHEKTKLLLNEMNTVKQNEIFKTWIGGKRTFQDENRRGAFVEALTLLQNFNLGLLLGFQKKDLLQRFSPKSNLKSLYITPIKKTLFNLCEELTATETATLIHSFEREHHVTEDNTNIDLQKYLEYKLLLWSCKDVINLGDNKEADISALLQHIKKLDLNDFDIDLERAAEKTNSESLKKSLSVNINLDKTYDIIDANNLGACVIINEKDFPGSEFKTRHGTRKDEERLLEVFTAFGFEVFLHNNVTYEELMYLFEECKGYVKENHSMFVLVILSHGSENIIYTSDSVAVTMDSIEMKFQSENCPCLAGKPKVFIIQSCQGAEWQAAQLETKSLPEIDVDSIVQNHVNPANVAAKPQKGDSLIAWSTVKGYASFRDPKNGSWYIEELCKELWRIGDISDLANIFTRVNNNLRSKIYNGQFMVPNYSSSLGGKVKLPTNKKKQQKGKEIKFQRLVFEKYFREFLMETDIFEKMLTGKDKIS